MSSPGSGSGFGSGSTCIEWNYQQCTHKSLCPGKISWAEACKNRDAPHSMCMHCYNDLVFHNSKSSCKLLSKAKGCMVCAMDEIRQQLPDSRMHRAPAMVPLSLAESKAFDALTDHEHNTTFGYNVFCGNGCNEHVGYRNFDHNIVFRSDAKHRVDVTVCPSHSHPASLSATDRCLGGTEMYMLAQKADGQIMQLPAHHKCDVDACACKMCANCLLHQYAQTPETKTATQCGTCTNHACPSCACKTKDVPRARFLQSIMSSSISAPFVNSAMQQLFYMMCDAKDEAVAKMRLWLSMAQELSKTCIEPSKENKHSAFVTSLNQIKLLDAFRDMMVLFLPEAVRSKLTLERGQHHHLQQEIKDDNSSRRVDLTQVQAVPATRTQSPLPRDFDMSMDALPELLPAVDSRVGSKSKVSIPDPSLDVSESEALRKIGFQLVMARKETASPKQAPSAPPAAAAAAAAAPTLQLVQAQSKQGISTLVPAPAPAPAADHTSMTETKKVQVAESKDKVLALVLAETDPPAASKVVKGCKSTLTKDTSSSSSATSRKRKAPTSDSDEDDAAQHAKRQKSGPSWYLEEVSSSSSSSDEEDQEDQDVEMRAAATALQQIMTTVQNSDQPSKRKVSLRAVNCKQCNRFFGSVEDYNLHRGQQPNCKPKPRSSRVAIPSAKLRAAVARSGPRVARATSAG